MPAYLSALTHSPEARASLGVERLVPAGMFYVGLRMRPVPGESRPDAESESKGAAAKAFRHRGRFDEDWLGRFDTRGEQVGEQFAYRITQKGRMAKRGSDALPTDAFASLLHEAEHQIRVIGQRVFAGEADVSPYRQGQTHACQHCPFQSVCRFDPWIQPYRPLTSKADPEPEGDACN